MSDNLLNKSIPWLENLTSVVIILFFFFTILWFLLDSVIEIKILPEYQSIKTQLQDIEIRLYKLENFSELKRGHAETYVK